jgi:LCP family protein required for cell wall assembly
MRRQRGLVRTLLLSFLWPGLGQWYAGQRARALAFALPPLLLVAALIAAIALDPLGFLVKLLVPTSAAAFLGLIALDAIWRSLSLIDAWHRGPRQPLRRDRTAPALVLLVSFVLIAHGFAGFYVASVGGAAERIFQGGGASGDDHGDLGDLDYILGGDQGGDQGGNQGGDAAGAQRCPAINPGDTSDYGDESDDPVNSSDTSDEPHDTGTEPGDGTPLPFDPNASPPPYECQPGTEGALPADGPINVLIIGIDSGMDRDHALTDTLMVVSYLPERDHLTMISIPRDTGRIPLYIGGSYRWRINTFMSFARRHPELFPEGPVNALMREVGYILGTKIHFYAATNLSGFPAAVDLVGGVDVNVPYPIADDKHKFFLGAGRQHLDGATALLYARSRYGPNNNDWQRSRRQQDLLRTLALKMRDPAMIARAPELMNTMAGLVRTNIRPGDLPMLLPVFNNATNAATDHYVLQPNSYAQRIPPAEVHGKYMTELNLAAVRRLSIDVFGSYSSYR